MTLLLEPTMTDLGGEHRVRVTCDDLGGGP